jgi:hypothetical protein
MPDRVNNYEQYQTAATYNEINTGIRGATNTTKAKYNHMSQRNVQTVWRAININCSIDAKATHTMMQGTFLERYSRSAG